MSDLLMLLKRVIGQKLLDVKEESDGSITLHFDDFVVTVKEAYVAPIIERVNW